MITNLHSHFKIFVVFHIYCVNYAEAMGVMIYEKVAPDHENLNELAEVEPHMGPLSAIKRSSEDKTSEDF